MIVDNYTYSEYCTLPDTEKEEFSTAIRFAKNLLKKDYIGDRDIDEWSFADVKELMQYAENGDGEGFTKYVIENVQGYGADKLMQARAYEVLLTFSFITEKIAEMIETEQTTLVAPIEGATRVALGQVDFSMFGYYPQLLELANNDPTKIDEVSKMKYCDAYTFLYYNTKKTELERAITNIYKYK